MKTTYLAVRASTLGVDDTLGDALPVKVGELVDQVEVLEQQGAHVPDALPGSGVGHRSTIGGGVRGLLIVPEGGGRGILGTHTGS